MKIRIKILIWSFLLAFVFILAHNFLYAIFRLEESFFLSLALIAIASSLFSGFYVLIYEITFSFRNKNNLTKGKKKALKNGNSKEQLGIRRKGTFGETFADKITSGLGSWKFIIIQSVILVAWMIVNIIAWRNVWDPYPFILLNLVLSFQAAYAAPIIMMSQNRSASRDRKKTDWDLATDRRAERGIAQIQKDFVRLELKISKILNNLEKQNKK